MVNYIAAGVVVGVFFALSIPEGVSAEASSPDGANKNVVWKKSEHIPLEASGVVQMKDGRFLVINDGDKNDEALTIIQLDAAGKNVLSSVPVPTAGKWSDLEGVTKNKEETYYAISGKGVLYRFEIENDKVVNIANEEIGKKLKEKLRNNSEDLDIEGLVWDGDQNKLIIGLRSPMQGNDKAVVFFVENPDDLIKGNNGFVIKTEEVDLGKRGVRAMTGTGINEIYIIGGPTEGGPDKKFKIFKGKVEEKNKISSVREMDYEDLEHAEGVAYFKIGGSERLLLVRDRSSEFDGADERKGKPGKYAIIDL